ncbi:MAG: N-(5'-phosphoribosyl)anthranilate isomerase [Bacteroidetes bacterium QS_7_67_15]|jgi:phosphoribosylanthranilate isomerase|nr:MAG: N-(5'-phosphoribosyl)anthranilate isomerase [Bacteroidetes bacterium QS_7_67_15]
MPPKLKICGITELEDARYCAGAGADYLGFIQHEDSPRYIAPDEAAKIIDWVHGPAPVGVFVNDPAEAVNRTADDAGFALVQLHGNEPPEVCAAIEAPVVKAVRVLHDASATQLRTFMEPYVEHVDFFLLDTHSTSLWGGTGESFNWRLARELSADFPLFLAGGIDSGNVEEAVRTMRPYAVDLSSGLETEPGKKSFEKMERFFETFGSLESALAEET